MVLSSSGTELTHARLAQQRAQAVELFPVLANAPGADFVFMARYAESIPARFFNRQATSILLTWLLHESDQPGGHLFQSLKAATGELDIAFRALGDANGGAGHDDEWPADYVAELDFVDRVVHPLYVKVCEYVLGAMLLPLAQGERRRRGKSEVIDALKDRVEEAARSNLREHLQPYDRILRNAITHGHVEYRQEGVHYKDTREERRDSLRSMTERCDALLDLCNGLAAAYRLFFSLRAEACHRNGVAPPLHMTIDELRAQCESPSWHLTGAVEYHGPNGKQLTMYAKNEFFDSRKAQYYTLVSATAAKRLVPHYEHYFVSMRGPGGSAGWGAFDGTKLVLDTNGDIALQDLAEACKPDGVIVFPPYLNRALEARGPARKVGTLVETARAQPRTIDLDKFQLAGTTAQLRSSRTHRKTYYTYIDARLLLSAPSIEAAVNAVRTGVRDLISAVSLRSRARDLARLSSAALVPVGYCEANLFLSDFRTRRLTNYGLGDKMLCRVTLKRMGRVRILGIAGGIHEQIDGVHIHWNSRAVSRALLGFA
jgi:hypothetical protein